METEDRVYLALKGARERLCRVQVDLVDEVDRAAIGKAIDGIDYVGVQLPQWSRFDGPDVPPSDEVRQGHGG